MHSADSFSIYKVIGSDSYRHDSGGFKTLQRGQFKVGSSKENKDSTTVPVSILQYNMGPSDILSKISSAWMENNLSWKVSHPSIVKALRALCTAEFFSG